jgi:hypothetical protein
MTNMDSPTTYPHTPATRRRETPSVSAPSGLPVLAELPELAGVLERLDTADRALLDAVVGLARLLEHDEVATTSGVSVETWIASVTRHTRSDANQTGVCCCAPPAG